MKWYVDINRPSSLWIENFHIVEYSIISRIVSFLENPSKDFTYITINDGIVINNVPFKKINQLEEWLSVFYYNTEATISITIFKWFGIDFNFSIPNNWDRNNKIFVKYRWKVSEEMFDKYEKIFLDFKKDINEED